MRGILSYVAVSIMAISALVATPTVTSATETEDNLPAMGLYDLNNMIYYSFPDFRKLSKSEKVRVFKEDFYIVADQGGNTVTKLDVLTLSNQGLEQAKTSHSKRLGVQWGDFVSVKKAKITSISNGKVTLKVKNIRSIRIFKGY